MTSTTAKLEDPSIKDQQNGPTAKERQDASKIYQDALTQWINDQLHLGSVPRVTDVIDHCARNNIKLSNKKIRELVRLHSSYHFNMHQQREPLASRKDRLIVTNSLGMLHLDLGFFPVVRAYETPKTFRYGFLAGRDVLSRYVYLELLEDRKTTKTLIRVFKRLLQKHRETHGHEIISFSFDKEAAVNSHDMRSFLKENNISLRLFENSSSKAKVAENLIRQVRTKVERLMRDDPKRRWWRLLPTIQHDLNSQEIILDGKKTGFAPREINKGNLGEFLKKVQKVQPSFLMAQFRIPPHMIKYKFKIGDYVRVKSLLASSQVIGIKRSQVNLGTQIFRVVDRQPYTTKDSSVRPNYRCKNFFSGDIETFAEQDLVLTSLRFLHTGEELEEHKNAGSEEQ